MYYTLIVGSGLITMYFSYYYVKHQINMYVIDKVMSKLNENMDSVAHFKQLGQNAALITFEHGGIMYNVTTLYNRRKGRNMARKEVYLIKSDDTKTNITHKQGLPYSLSAADMGGKEIIVIKDSQTIKTYDINTIPNFLDN